MRETALKLGVKYYHSPVSRATAYESITGKVKKVDDKLIEDDCVLWYFVDFDPDYASRLLNLSSDLRDELIIIYKLADDQSLIIDDIKDLKTVCNAVLNHIKDYTGTYYFNEKNLRAIIRAIVLCECNDKRQEDFSNNNITTLSDITTGEEFEQYCANLLVKNGYEKVSTTSATGDHGVDITAEKDTITYAIQCKYYSSPVGNSAVQEAYSGKKIYSKDIAVVMTNSVFTKQATEDAMKLGVKLWDGNILENL